MQNASVSQLRLSYVGANLINLINSLSYTPQLLNDLQTVPITMLKYFALGIMKDVGVLKTIRYAAQTSPRHSVLTVVI